MAQKPHAPAVPVVPVGPTKVKLPQTLVFNADQSWTTQRQFRLSGFNVLVTEFVGVTEEAGLVQSVEISKAEAAR